MTCDSLCINACDIKPPPLPQWMTDEIFKTLVERCPSWNIYQDECLGIGSNLTPSINPVLTELNRSHVSREVTSVTGHPDYIVVTTAAETGSLWWIFLIVLFFVVIAILILVYLKKKNKLTKIACLARVSSPMDDSRSQNNGSCGSHDKMAMEEQDGTEKPEGRYSPFPKRAAIQGETNGRVMATPPLPGLHTPVYYNKIRGHNDYVDIDQHRGADTNKGRLQCIDNDVAVTYLTPLANMEHEGATEDVNLTYGANANFHNEDRTSDNLHDIGVVPRVPYKLPPLVFQQESGSRNRSKKKRRSSVNETPLKV